MSTQRHLSKHQDGRHSRPRSSQESDSTQDSLDEYHEKIHGGTPLLPISSRESSPPSPSTKHPISRKSVLIRILAIINLISLFSWFYLEALAGGDIEWVKDHLSFLGANLVLSVVCFTLALSLIMLTPMSRTFSNCMFACMGLVLFALKKWDEGESFQQHGAYNMLVFLVISIPLNGLIQLILFMQRTMAPNKFRRVMTTNIVGNIIVVTLTLIYYHSIWGNGANGAHLIHGEINGTQLCEWGGSNIPFVDLLPNHIQNFWTGRLTCPVVKGIEAEWSYDGILTISCLNKGFIASGQDPTYDVLPDTRPWPAEDKIRLTYNKIIVKRTERFNYTEPVLVNNEGVESIIANCEPGVSKVLIRVIRNDAVLDRVKAVGEASRLESNIANTAQGEQVGNSIEKANRNHKNEERTKPNVMVIFMDAVSRRQFYRKLAKSSAVVGSLDKTAQGGPQLHEFFRYHAVGFNTDDNSRAVYSNTTQILDPPNLPIWKDFYEDGYITSRVEDNCDDWSAHYTGITTSQYFDHELQAPFCLPPYYALEGNPFSNFEGPHSIVSRCMHGTNVHNHAFEYMNQFRRAYPDKPWFQMGSFIEGHDGTGEVLLTIDNDLSKFFKGMEEDGTLENTIIFIMADHGLHMGINFMFSPNGRIEHMNPYLSVIMPPLVTKRYPSLSRGLMHNQQSLVTGFEIHATLKLLASGKLFNDVEGNNNDMKGDGWRKGTLFDETLDISRTCEQAKIPEEYCSCRVPN
ncbi:hypothetical protein BGX27_011491 [Mortierella sp. AM989]|nr:hypothetical protein BGX27_011491 [Mortierella sp. AM989]